MRVYGIRVCPQSWLLPQSEGESEGENTTDFWYIFKHLAPRWPDCYFAAGFETVSTNRSGIEDPIQALRERYGPDFLAANLQRQTLLLRWAAFELWAVSKLSNEGFAVDVFKGPLSSGDADRLFRPNGLRSISGHWRPNQQAIIHCWDDIYWQMFTTDRSAINELIRIHDGDAKLKLYAVDFAHEFPEPSNRELQPAKILD